MYKSCVHSNAEKSLPAQNRPSYLSFREPSLTDQVVEKFSARDMFENEVPEKNVISLSPQKRGGNLQVHVVFVDIVQA